ncbi:MAG: rod-binding protein [Sulfurimonas sp.]
MIELNPYQKEIPNIGSTLDKAKLKEQTDAFEAVILKILLDTGMENEKNLFSDVKDPGDKIFKSMYREELANASAGSFGFSELLFNYLSQKA